MGIAAATGNQLQFTNDLNQVINRVHSASNIDEIMLDVSRDVCSLLNADRLTIYVVGEDGSSLVSKVKTGLNSFKDLKLPIAEQSVAGFVGVHKRIVNIKDVYDGQELAGLSPQLRFLKEVDTRTGYRTKQMLVVPIVDVDANLVGVIQVINNKAGDSFSPMVEAGAQELAQSMALSLRQRQNIHVVRSKYDFWSAIRSCLLLN
jgi:GAF domain-containing protein